MTGINASGSGGRDIRGQRTDKMTFRRYFYCQWHIVPGYSPLVILYNKSNTGCLPLIFMSRFNHCIITGHCLRTKTHTEVSNPRSAVHLN